MINQENPSSRPSMELDFSYVLMNLLSRDSIKGGVIPRPKICFQPPQGRDYTGYYFFEKAQAHSSALALHDVQVNELKQFFSRSPRSPPS